MRWLAFYWLPGTDRPDLLRDEDWQRVEWALSVNPQAGPIISGSGGARKLRIGLAGRGNRGGARTIYVYLPRLERVYFLATYGKNERADLTPTERASLREIIEQLQREGG